MAFATDIELHRILVWSTFVLAGVTALALVFVSAPYGRHRREGWGPTLPSRLGWVIMELPAVLWFAAVYACGSHRAELVPLCLLAMWQLHYVNRALVFPLRMRSRGKRMPVLIVALAITWNLLNGYINGRWISELGSYSPDWLGDPRFVAGAALFLAGWVINLRADATLRNLRRGADTGYHIPRGGLYEMVSCPNYLGEIIAWLGWALATWSLAGLAFAVYTIANLAPRAFQHHRWYRETFPDYPERRRALIPFIA